MTNNVEIQTSQKRKKIFKIFGLIVLITAVAYSFYYYFLGSKHIKTDNAYVGAEMAQINAAVGGVIKEVKVTDTQEVSAGEVLVLIDNIDAKLAVANSKASLKKAQAEMNQSQSILKRRKALRAADSASEEELTNAINEFEAAKANYEAAKVVLEQAELDLERTIIKAPISGTIARRQVQLGQRVQVGTNLMSITPKDKMHIDANFKEVQLKKVKIGQPVKIFSDKYGEDVIYHGKVVGFAGGTGSSFSVIPAQNATGNWIKVVQRVPVRIELLPEELSKHPLQVGLSMHVDVDVSNNFSQE